MPSGRPSISGSRANGAIRSYSSVPKQCSKPSSTKLPPAVAPSPPCSATRPAAQPGPDEPEGDPPAELPRRVVAKPLARSTASPWQGFYRVALRDSLNPCQQHHWCEIDDSHRSFSSSNPLLRE